MGNPGGGGGGGKKKREEDDGLPLHKAARSGDLQALQSICIANPLAINSRDKHSRTPLHLAAWSGHTQAVSYLCKNKADVGAAAMDDMGAIHFAAQKGHLEIVRILLLSGVSIKACNRKGLTALHYAAQGSNLELVKYLVRKGGSLTAKTKAGKTPLDLAKNEDIVSFLKECQDSSKQGAILTDKVETEEPDSKPSLEDKAAVSSCTDEAVNKLEKEEDSKDEQVKRKGEEAELEESSSKPKKTRIALNHLLTSDDTLEEI